MESSSIRHHIYLGLGSNVGDRQANLLAALTAFPPQLDILARSPVYQTDPWGYLDQDDFLNQVVKVGTDLSPHELLSFLKEIEQRLGRVKRFKNGPREIDIDILFIDDAVIEKEGLRIPHPHLAERAFVLVPLNDIAPKFVHPVFNKTINQLLSELDPEPLEKIEVEAS